MVVPPTPSLDNHYLSLRLVVGSGHVEVLNRKNKPVFGCIAATDRQAMKFLALCLDDVIEFRKKRKHEIPLE